jgi:hypothetical protein
MRGAVFIAIGLAAMGVGLFKPAPLNAKAQRASIAATMARHGFFPTAQSEIGNALIITEFSSPSCGPVRVLPVSMLFQEAALLPSGPHDRRFFVYRSWSGSDPARAALLHLVERFRQMVRLEQNPAMDTMLYIVSPRACERLPSDWSGFWRGA